MTLPLRQRLRDLTPEAYRDLCRETELEHFRATTRFCGSCGSAMRPGPLGQMLCDACGNEVFPRLNPAIVVLVTRDEEALLVHARSFTTDFHALVAGFVEAGENLEQCVAREVAEETSLRITDIRYFGSQAWPFPSQLMIAFTARYAGGEILFSDGELSAGGWFRRESLPPLPSPPSLSRRLIDAWVKGELH